MINSFSAKQHNRSMFAFPVWLLSFFQSKSKKLKMGFRVLAMNMLLWKKTCFFKWAIFLRNSCSSENEPKSLFLYLPLHGRLALAIAAMHRWCFMPRLPTQIDSLPSTVDSLCSSIFRTLSCAVGIYTEKQKRQKIKSLLHSVLLVGSGAHGEPGFSILYYSKIACFNIEVF